MTRLLASCCLLPLLLLVAMAQLVEVPEVMNDEAHVGTSVRKTRGGGTGGITGGGGGSTGGHAAHGVSSSGGQGNYPTVTGSMGGVSMFPPQMGGGPMGYPMGGGNPYPMGGDGYSGGHGGGGHGGGGHGGGMGGGGYSGGHGGGGGKWGCNPPQYCPPCQYLTNWSYPWCKSFCISNIRCFCPKYY